MRLITHGISYGLRLSTLGDLSKLNKHLLFSFICSVITFDCLPYVEFTVTSGIPNEWA